MNNLVTRAISGAVYVALIVTCTLMGETTFFALTALLAVVGICELESLLSKLHRIPAPSRGLDVTASLMVIGGLYLFLTTGDILMTLTAVTTYIPLRIMAAVASRSDNQARAFLYSLLAICYITIPLAMLFIGYILLNRWVILSVFIIIWVNDTGAYLSGCTLGRHKLCERLSPKKTWEGFWGGFILAVIAGAIAGHLIYCSTEATVAMGVFGAVISVTGTFGDLFESMIKRTVGVKDSGNIIPGHGGILDRIDSLLAVSPLVLLFALFFAYIIF